MKTFAAEAAAETFIIEAYIIPAKLINFYAWYVFISSQAKHTYTDVIPGISLYPLLFVVAPVLVLRNHSTEYKDTR